MKVKRQGSKSWTFVLKKPKRFLLRNHEWTECFCMVKFIEKKFRDGGIVFNDYEVTVTISLNYLIRDCNDSLMEWYLDEVEINSKSYQLWRGQSIAENSWM